MQITRQADYAIRAVMYLAQIGPEEKAPTNQIAKKQGIPLSFLAKIVAQLSVSGLLITMRGARGGVSLARPAEEINLLEVVEAIDGPISLSNCVNGYQNDCPIEDCGMHSVWVAAQDDLTKRLKSAHFGVPEPQLINL